jgi:hypothetical protein
VGMAGGKGDGVWGIPVEGKQLGGGGEDGQCGNANAGGDLAAAAAVTGMSVGDAPGGV